MINHCIYRPLVVFIIQHMLTIHPINELAGVLAKAINVGLEDLVKTEVLNKDNYTVHYYEQYKKALQCEDIISKYMCLYNILLQLFTDSQRKVDEFIESSIGIQKMEYTSGPKGRESKFTRLRNEIGHKRENKTFDQTKAEMEEYMDELMTVVKKAIKQI